MGHHAAWLMDNEAENGKQCHLYSCVDQWVPPDLIGGKDNDRFLSGGLESQCGDQPPPEPTKQPTGGYIHQEGWFGLGRRMDWYLAPTPGGGFDFTKALFDLTGAPAVPPLFGMAFMATYWGYDNMSQVEGYMHEFRNRQLPIDSFIMDYDWFGPAPCPEANQVGAEAGAPTPQGGSNCGDCAMAESNPSEDAACLPPTALSVSSWPPSRQMATAVAGGTT